MILKPKEVEFEMIVCVVQCFRCFDAVPVVAKMRVNTETLRCDRIMTLGMHCDWFWYVTDDNALIARNVNSPGKLRVEIGHDASTPEQRALWFRASLNL